MPQPRRTPPWSCQRGCRIFAICRQNVSLDQPHSGTPATTRTAAPGIRAAQVPGSRVDGTIGFVSRAALVKAAGVARAGLVALQEEQPEAHYRTLVITADGLRIHDGKRH